MACSRAFSSFLCLSLFSRDFIPTLPPHSQGRFKSLFYINHAEVAPQGVVVLGDHDVIYAETAFIQFGGKWKCQWTWSLHGKQT